MTTRKGTHVLAPAKSDDVFHFVIYGDRTGGVPAGLQVLKQAVADTNLLDPDLVMTVGDLIQGYNEKPEWMRQMKEFKGIMEELKMNWYPVAGNHDVYWRGPGEAPEGHHESNYEEHFGPLWYSFRHKNAGFITLYSDEGDRETNRKGFNQGSLQKMSKEQLAFLDKALTSLKDADHVFVFLHHPRWIGGGYAGGNWDVVHKKLKEAGNVSAVFAGHIHHMRYDPQDGIEYFALATTGGNLSADFPQAGYLHHLNMVSVRKDRVTVSAMPVGAVFDPKDFTPAFRAAIDQARRIRPVQTSPEVMMRHNGEVAGKITVKIANPSPRPVSGTLMFDPATRDDHWSASLDHQHLEIAPSETKEFSFEIFRTPGSPENAALPMLRMNLEYIGESARIQLPDVVVPIGLQLDRVPVDFFANSKNQCLKVMDGQDAIRVNADEIKVPDGPMTLEAWVQPVGREGYRAIIAKTESSEYALFSDEGVPQFDIHLNGKYVTAKATQKLPEGQWTHLAGVYDGERVMMFVDGKLIESTQASGKRRVNQLPLFVGADPNRRGAPTRSFTGMIDEVRLSKSAVYSEAFEPAKRLKVGDDTVFMLHLDKNIGPFVLDESSSAAKGVMGSAAKLVPVSKN